MSYFADYISKILTIFLYMLNIFLRSQLIIQLLEVCDIIFYLNKFDTRVYHEIAVTLTFSFGE